MSNTMRWRYGDTNPVLLPVSAFQAIEIGDLVHLSNGQAAPASSLSDQGTLAGNQETFHDSFVGVAMQASAANDATPIRIATSGVFEFEQEAAAAELGDLLGADEGSGGDELVDQQVVAVATENLAIGRCAKQAAASSTRVLVEIDSTVMRGGSQAAA